MITYVGLPVRLVLALISFTLASTFLILITSGEFAWALLFKPSKLDDAIREFRFIKKLGEDHYNWVMDGGQ